MSEYRNAPIGRVTVTVADATVTLDPIPPPAPGQLGRPARYTPVIAARVLSELQQGRTLTDIAREDWSPALGVLTAWIATDSGFADAVARARAVGAAAMADHTIDIADSAEPDERGRVEKARLRVASRQWLAGKWNQRFADKQIVQHQQGVSDRADALDDGALVTLIEALRRQLAQRQAVTVDASAVPDAHGSGDTAAPNPTSYSVPIVPARRSK